MQSPPPPVPRGPTHLNRLVSRGGLAFCFLAAAARRFGPNPEDSPAGYDLQQLAGWSSNLATNRLRFVIRSAHA